MTGKNSFDPKCHGCVFFVVCVVSVFTWRWGGLLLLNLFSSLHTTKKDTSVTFWAERTFFCHAYDTSVTIIVTKPGIIVDVVGSYFYDKKS